MTEWLSRQAALELVQKTAVYEIVQIKLYIILFPSCASGSKYSAGMHASALTHKNILSDLSNDEICVA
jgi:hypothetical protein